jgi:hypothetical protein
MTAITKVLLICSLAGACALALLPRAAAQEEGSRPGDESLSCDAIYAQGMAIVQVEQQQRDATRSKMEAQVKGTAALVGAAMTVGQLDPTHATGIAAQAAAEGTMKSQIDLGAQAGAVKPDARKERLRTLWTQKHCTKN